MDLVALSGFKFDRRIIVSGAVVIPYLGSPELINRDIIAGIRIGYLNKEAVVNLLCSEEVFSAHRRSNVPVVLNEKIVVIMTKLLTVFERFRKEVGHHSSSYRIHLFLEPIYSRCIVVVCGIVSRTSVAFTAFKVGDRSPFGIDSSRKYTVYYIMSLLICKYVVLIPGSIKIESYTGGCKIRSAGIGRGRNRHLKSLTAVGLKIPYLNISSFARCKLKAAEIGIEIYSVSVKPVVGSPVFIYLFAVHFDNDTVVHLVAYKIVCSARLCGDGTCPFYEIPVIFGARVMGSNPGEALPAAHFLGYFEKLVYRLVKFLTVVVLCTSAPVKNSTYNIYIGFCVASCAFRDKKFGVQSVLYIIAGGIHDGKCRNHTHKHGSDKQQ